MPSHDTDPLESIRIDVNDARAAYEALKPRFDSIPHDRVRIPRIDVQKAALHAFGLSERDRAEARAPGFESLARAEVIAPQPLERYALAALAAWYARQQQVRFAAYAAGAVPTAVADESMAVKRRMLKVVEHYFGEHPRYGIEIAAIRAGSGHQDTANDLQLLADLYEVPEVHAVISGDPVHYRDTDVRDGRALAGEIFRALGYETKESAEWTARVHRAYTHLHDQYAEHCRAGGLLFFRSEDVNVTYPPSLVSVVRNQPSRAKGESTDSTDGAMATEQTTTATSQAEREDEAS